jgi:hypothetical protein
LTVDDVAIDGKVVTMTGSSSDTAVFTAGTNGTLSIVTTDAAAAAANITITADGTAELAGTTVTLNSSGGVTLDADNGTITFADAGSSLGTITSSGYSGTAAVATTVTITDNESTNENNAIVFTAGADLDGGNLGLESDGDLFYNPSTGTLTSTISNFTHAAMTGNMTTADNSLIQLGAGNDLRLTHNGTNSQIKNMTGNLEILSDGLINMQDSGSNETFAIFNDNGAVVLYHDNSAKFATSATGVTVTGTAIATTDTDTSNTGNVTLDFAANQNFVLTMTGNVTLVNPTTEQVGQSGFITLIQDGTGSRTLAVGNQYFGPGGAVPTISTAANSIDIIPYIVIAAGKIALGEAQLAFADAS